MFDGLLKVLDGLSWSTFVAAGDQALVEGEGRETIIS